MIESPDFMGYSDDELKLMQTKLKAEAAEHDQQAAKLRAQNDAIQGQLDIRALNRFWQMHPGIRLNPGDKLAHDFSNIPAYMPLTVHSILTEDEAVLCTTVSEDWLPVVGGDFQFFSTRLPIESAQWMRKAYLDKMDKLAQWMRKAYLDKADDEQP